MLPFVLAGPIVRRVDASSATFWIALSEPATVQAVIWLGADQDSTGPGTVASNSATVARSDTVPARKWGEHLYTATVTARTDGGAGMNPGALFSYDLLVNGSGLRDLGLLADDSGEGGGIHAGAPARLALGYRTDRLPTFAGPAADIPGLRLAHTSCRKPHGPGPDALAWLDDIIAGERPGLPERPQLLLLTGDQIYADDVAAPLLPMLQAVAGEILGYTETVPLTETEHAEVTELPTLRRDRLTAEVARFTSTAARSHLLGFGEFAAMYLACWSPRVWRTLPATATLFADVPPERRDALHLTDLGGKTDEQKKESVAKAVDERTAVDGFAGTVARVARVLANCATYMIFDDHEITDDWYISAPWRARTLTSPLGRAVIRNGLMAYAVFQAPGNDPDHWLIPQTAGPPEAPGLTLHLAMGTLLAERAAKSTEHPEKIDELLRLVKPPRPPEGQPEPGAEAKARKELRFHFTIDGPRHRILVLDTRTRRTYESAIRDSPPQLLGESLDAMLPAGPLPGDREVLIVVSAVPLLFPRIFDALVQPAAAAFFDFKNHLSGAATFDPANPRPVIVGSEQWDVEGWGAHEGAFHATLRRLATYPRVVVLGGDVHFASSLVCDLWTRGDDTARSRILQCTSSAAKNQPDEGQRAVLRAQRSAQRLLRGPAVERLGWDAAHGVVLPPGAAISPGRRGRLLSRPAFVPARDWPAGTTIAAGNPPDVRYRISVLRDERPTAAMGVGAPVSPSLPAMNAADPIVTYASVAAAHQQLLAQLQDPVRLMVFRSNVGLVSFAPSPTGAGEYVATHTLLSPVGDGATGSGFTQHGVDLARTAAAPPPALIAGG
ncbi:hypothetical protein [Winogradskya humida]|uniref:PhoD-like phosphatase n=1 Tax=Winogradskya humida TaxID=113566 RepID=A0ABQ3ZYI1_9ACTN|nr:hypothetical protein [Actinoplanes humidus]GIE23641.1 hypothetical protein Ahu01nite_067430 [Actinoplanes humidus]